MSVPTAARPTARRPVDALLGLVVGSFAVNSLPHLFHGLTGSAFQTPFGADSSATVNLVWGAANLALAAGTGWLSRGRARTVAYLVGAAGGVVGTGVSLLVLLP